VSYSWGRQAEPNLREEKKKLGLFSKLGWRRKKRKNTLRKEKGTRLGEEKCEATEP